MHEPTEHERAGIDYRPLAPGMEAASHRAGETGFHQATTRRVARKLAAELQSVPEVATDLPGSRSSCEPHRSFIEAEVAKRRNAIAIYQDLVEHHGYGGAYNAAKRFVGKLRPPEPKISCRFETEPGKKRKSTMAGAV